jgi:Kef-type K+ transport system membrane component KefB/nucleotide-binding universal stress UspA family protein
MMRTGVSARWLVGLLALVALAAALAFAVTAQPHILPHLHAHGAAAGNGSSENGRAEGILVGEIIVLLVAGRLLGEAMQRIGQPALMGQLLAGIVLGPSLLGWLWPEAQKFLFPPDAAQRGMLDGLSQFGILLLLLLTGMETDLRLVRRSGFAAIAVAICGIALPFGCGLALGEFLPASLVPGGNRLVTSLFLGTALSISSIKIVAMVVREMNFMRRNLGQIIVATAIMEDTIGWVIVALIFGVAGATGGGLDVPGLLRTMAGVAAFLVFCFTAGRWLVFAAIRWVNDNFRSEYPVITVILVIMGCAALITQALGVRTVLGAFMAGVLIGESPILGSHIQQQLRGMITAFFMPVFFGMSGLSADLTILGNGTLALLALGLVAIASLGKFSGAFAGALLGRLSWREGLALGCAMNARGSTEVIVASIGLAMGALSQNLYTMIVAMAVVTTMAMPPMLRAALARVPMRPEEKSRIEREEIDQRGYLPRLERLLLLVDDSAAGRFMARLAGLVAGGRGMPVTILKTGRPAQSSEDSLAHEVKSGAKASAAKVGEEEEGQKPEKVHVTERPAPAAKTAQGETVAEEAQKGYGLLFVGLAGARGPGGAISPAVTAAATGFDGNLAILAHDGKLERLRRDSRLLVAVNGTEVSRRAAEISFTIARATGAAVTVIYVSRANPKSATRRQEEGVLRDILQLAERYEVNAASRIAARTEAADAILAEAGRSRYDLIVMGTNLRAGEGLFFGNTATRILAGWEKSVLILGFRPEEQRRELGEAKDGANRKAEKP